ncbi:hypothetical protein Taro_007031 [Colocasia esculenta]|uniref:Uncharacterized protein n=1 Tax=Colocasia esculenta TaxID=4460 RepID=A0A843U2L3_COLES|nr:hypothetical protein [Colocasia esculenta]
MIQCRHPVPDSKIGLLGGSSSVDLPAFGVDLTEETCEQDSLRSASSVDLPWSSVDTSGLELLGFSSILHPENYTQNPSLCCGQMTRGNIKITTSQKTSKKMTFLI